MSCDARCPAADNVAYMSPWSYIGVGALASLLGAFVWALAADAGGMLLLVAMATVLVGSGAVLTSIGVVAEGVRTANRYR